MANYKDPSILYPNTSAGFDALHGPSYPTPASGIYKCQNCNHEVASNKGGPLPPQNHAQHPPGTPIIWKLIVACSENGVA